MGSGKIYETGDHWLLNSDYKIIAKILAERLKVVLPKLIHSDKKWFVKGSNLSEANRLIQDVI